MKMPRFLAVAALAGALAGGGVAAATPMPPPPAPVVPSMPANPLDPNQTAPALPGQVPADPVPAPTSQATAPANPAPAPAAPTAPATPAPTDDGSGWVDRTPEEVNAARAEISTGPTIAEKIAQLCMIAPEPGGAWIADSIDPGPSTPMPGVYGTYGYRGFNSVHPYGTGCKDMLLNNAVDALGGNSLGTVGGGVSVFTSQGPATVGADRAFTAAAVLTAVLARLVRVAFGTDQIWDVLDPIFQATRVVTGWQALVAFLALALTVLLGYVMLQRLTLQRVTEVIARSFLILVAGIAAAMWTGNIGPMMDRAVGATYATVAGFSQGEIPDAGSATADALVSGVIAPAWTFAHLGDGEGVPRFGERLHASAAFTRAEDDATAGNKAERDRLIGAKKEDWKATAREVETTAPGAYEVLSAIMHPNRSLGAAVALLGVVSVCIVGYTTGGFAAFGRVVIRGAVAFAPLLALIGMTGWGAAVFLTVWDKTKTWFVASLAGTALFVAYLNVVIVPIGRFEGISFMGRAVAYVVFFILACVVWHWRDAIKAKLKIDKDLNKAKKVTKQTVKKTAEKSSEVARRGLEMAGAKKPRRGKSAKGKPAPGNPAKEQAPDVDKATARKPRPAAPRMDKPADKRTAKTTTRAAADAAARAGVKVVTAPVPAKGPTRLAAKTMRAGGGRTRRAPAPAAVRRSK